MALRGHNRGPGGGEGRCCSPLARGFTILSRFFDLLVFLFSKLLQALQPNKLTYYKDNAFQGNKMYKYGRYLGQSG